MKTLVSSVLGPAMLFGAATKLDSREALFHLTIQKRIEGSIRIWTSGSPQIADKSGKKLKERSVAVR